MKELIETAAWSAGLERGDTAASGNEFVKVSILGLEGDEP